MTRSLLGPATLLALGVGAVCTAVASVAGGGRAALSAAGATALVLGFLWFGQLPEAQAARGRKHLATALLIIGYTVRVAVVVLALRLLLDSAAFDRRVFGVCVLLCVLAWTGGAAWSLVRWRSVTIEAELSKTTGVSPR